MFTKPLGRQRPGNLDRRLRPQQDAVRARRAAARAHASPKMREVYRAERSSRLKSSVCVAAAAAARFVPRTSSPGTGGSWPPKPPPIIARRFPASATSTAREIAELLDEGSRCPAVDYAEALIRREELRSELAALLSASTRTCSAAW